MEIVVYKSSDTGSGFHAEHIALLDKLATCKVAKATLSSTIFDNSTKDDRAEADISNMTAEVAVRQAESDYLVASAALEAKIATAYPIAHNFSDGYQVLLPDENEFEDSSNVTLLYLNE